MISYTRYVAALHSIFMCVFVCMCVPYKLEVVVFAQRSLGTEVLKGVQSKRKTTKSVRLEKEEESVANVTRTSQNTQELTHAADVMEPYLVCDFYSSNNSCWVLHF